MVIINLIELKTGMKMKNLRWVLASGFVSLIFIGCADDQPSFNPNNKGLVVVAGNTYIIPLEANYSLEPFRNENNPGILKLRQAGVDCRKGDITWISTEVQKAAQEARLDGDVNRAASIVIEAPRKGYIGCAHPISREEYENFRKKQQK